TQSVRLADALDQISAPVHCAYPMTMEELGADFGFVLYETVVDYAVEARPLEIEPLRDRVHIFIDGKFAGIKERDRRNDEVRVTVQPGNSVKISLLVENLGRVNYGVTMSDNRKGLPGGARLGQQYLFGWTMYPLTMDDLSGLHFAGGAQADCPVFYAVSWRSAANPPIPLSVCRALPRALWWSTASTSAATGIPPARRKRFTCPRPFCARVKTRSSSLNPTATKRRRSCRKRCRISAEKKRTEEMLWKRNRCIC
ncbi:MAG: hypothetical protein IKC99_03300, partial [Clostridia bacterium]|nr:hypothetical protein [Clostridia bacterium]